MTANFKSLKINIESTLLRAIKARFNHKKLMGMNKIKINIFYLLLLFVLIGAACQSGHNLPAGSEDKGKLRFTSETPYETVKVNPVESGTARNVILMIGDGMGLVQTSAAWVANRGSLNLDNFQYTGLVRTYAADKLITDSGAAGTAMATGQKTKYHSVGVDANGNPLPSLTDLANAKGLSTAVLVTCGLTDATPAAFCANNPDRDSEEEIALDYLSCGVDFIFGGGRKKFNQREDKRDLLAEMQQAGYKVATTWEQTAALQSGKVLAIVEEGQLPLYPVRGELFQNAAMHALNMLARNESGFFAVLEGSRIDDCGHWHDLPKLVNEITDFDLTIGRVLQWAENDGNTLVIVLADHETGGLTLLDGDINTGYVQAHFSTGGHSGILVPVYAYGPGAQNFTGVFENTGVFMKIVQILNLL
jgi:alkaline phosphatase